MRNSVTINAKYISDIKAEDFRNISVTLEGVDLDDVLNEFWFSDVVDYVIYNQHRIGSGKMEELLEAIGKKEAMDYFDLVEKDSDD